VAGQWRDDSFGVDVPSLSRAKLDRSGLLEVLVVVVVFEKD
jgi:hypothetical protein